MQKKVNKSIVNSYFRIIKIDLLTGRDWDNQKALKVARLLWQNSIRKFQNTKETY